MKKLILEILGLLLLILLVDFLYFKIKGIFGNKWLLSVGNHLVKTILIFLLIETVLYKRFFTLYSHKLKVGLCVIIPLMVSVHISKRLSDIDDFYDYFKNVTYVLFSPKLWDGDPMLSHKGVPNARGYFQYYLRDTIRGEIPVILDSNGFRTVEDSLQIQSGITNLFLGCSYTFGENIEAQYSYPYLTSRQLNQNYINAGVSAYGLGQMFAIANEYIPKKKFKYVFIQLSDWLADRAMQINFGRRPYPYFSDMKFGFQLNRPIYSSLVVDGINWRQTKRTYLDRFYFSITDGLKVGGYGYYLNELGKARINAGLIPVPTKNKRGLEIYFYDSLINLCKKNNSIPIVLKVQYPDSTARELVRYISKKAMVIDLDSTLDQYLKKTGRTFTSAFNIYHVEKRDTIYYDDHPNELANKLFSESIYQSLNH